MAVLIAHHHKGAEGDPPPSLHDLGDPVDMDDALGKVQRVSFDLIQIFSFLDFDPFFPEAGGQCLHAAVKLEPTAVKDHSRHPRGQRLTRQQLADQPSRCCLISRLPLLPDLSRKRRGGSQRLPLFIVDDLGVNVPSASEYTEARTGSAAYNTLPDSAMTPLPTFLFSLVTHQRASSPRCPLRPMRQPCPLYGESARSRT